MRTIAEVLATFWFSLLSLIRSAAILPSFGMRGGRVLEVGNIDVGMHAGELPYVVFLTGR